MSPNPASQVRQAGLLAAVLVPLALSGCAGDAAAAPLEAKLQFPRTGEVSLPPGLVVWAFWVENAGGRPSPEAALDLQVDFAHGTMRDSAVVAVPPLDPGQAVRLELTTLYRGPGHYNGTATLLVDGLEVDRELVAFERCVVAAWVRGRCL